MHCVSRLVSWPRKKLTTTITAEENLGKALGLQFVADFVDNMNLAVAASALVA